MDHKTWRKQQPRKWNKRVQRYQEIKIFHKRRKIQGRPAENIHHPKVHRKTIALPRQKIRYPTLHDHYFPARTIESLLVRLRIHQDLELPFHTVGVRRFDDPPHQ